jgi:hypothetical protein
VSTGAPASCASSGAGAQQLAGDGRQRAHHLQASSSPLSVSTRCFGSSMQDTPSSSTQRHSLQYYCTVLLRWAAYFSGERPTVFWCGVAVLDPKFAQESESGLRSVQSPAGKDENCMQSMSEIYRQSSLASRPAGCWLAGHASLSKSQSN